MFELVGKQIKNAAGCLHRNTVSLTLPLSENTQSETVIIKRFRGSSEPGRNVSAGRAGGSGEMCRRIGVGRVGVWETNSDGVSPLGGWRRQARQHESRGSDGASPYHTRGTFLAADPPTPTRFPLGLASQARQHESRGSDGASPYQRPVAPSLERRADTRRPADPPPRRPVSPEVDCRTRGNAGSPGSGGASPSCDYCTVFRASRFLSTTSLGNGIYPRSSANFCPSVMPKLTNFLTASPIEVLSYFL